MARLRVALHFWGRFHRERVPENLPRGLVERQEPPLLSLAVIRRGDVAIQPHLQLRFLW